MRFKDYALPQTAEEAWQLNQQKSNRVLAGGMWLRYEKRPFQTAIDLSGLHLDQIGEQPDFYRVGAMVSLHALERHEGLNALTGGAVRSALSHIVGVQFRNSATVGGSVYNKSGFSDVLTLLMALDAKAVLYQAGEIAVSEYAGRKKDRDLLMYVDIPKAPVLISYQSVRSSQTGFPLLTCAVAKTEDGVRVAVGARPARAALVEMDPGETPEAFAGRVQNTLTFGDNALASARYRRQITGVLVRRGLEKIIGEGGEGK